jgi:hypothetical protein
MDKGHRKELEAFAQTIRRGGDWPIPLWQQVQATEIACRVEEQIRPDNICPPGGLHIDEEVFTHRERAQTGVGE